MMKQLGKPEELANIAKSDNLTTQTQRTSQNRPQNIQEI
jgi:hypothetical protein